MTHTEGPWVASVPKKEKHMQARWITGNGFFIAKAYWHDGQPVDGNARLIAAAPELLEALESVLTAIRWSGWSIDDPKWKEPMVEARRAIAKANGE